MLSCIIRIQLDCESPLALLFWNKYQVNILIQTEVEHMVQNRDSQKENLIFGKAKEGQNEKEKKKGR